MPGTPNRVVIDRLDWKSVLPVLRLASAFKHSLQPGKLVVALAAVVLIHLSGVTLNALLGVNESNDSPGAPGAYERIVELEAGAFESMVNSALALEHGLGPSSEGVADALHAMVVGVPYWAFDTHPWFTLLFAADVLFVLAMASGILTRMSASQVCANRSTSMRSATSFVAERWAWYLLTPLMPAILIAVIGVVLALAGLLLFNLPGLDVVGSVGYGLLLALGFIVAVVALLLLFAVFLMPLALSVEGSDGFDAIARSFNYILFRPWQFAVYLLASVAYLVAVYVLVGAVASLTIDAAGYFVEFGAMTGTDESDFADQTRFESIVAGDPNDVGGTVGVGSWIVARWLELVSAIVTAILFSTLCCLQTQAYVLMRRSADGTPMDQCEGSEQGDELWAEKPAEQAEGDDASKAEG